MNREILWVWIIAGTAFTRNSLILRRGPYHFLAYPPATTAELQAIVFVHSMICTHGMQDKKIRVPFRYFFIFLYSIEGGFKFPA